MMKRLAILLSLIGAGLGAAPATATRYVEIFLQTYATVDVSGDVFDQGEVFSSSLHATVDLDDLTAPGGYQPTLPDSIVTGLSLDPSNFGAFTLTDGFFSLTTSYIVPLGGLDLTKPFAITLRNVGYYDAQFDFFDGTSEASGTIAFASIHSFDGEGIANSVSFTQNWYQVPEPATWALMLAGFGLVGAAMRTRRKAAVSFG